jgi:Thymidylate synthase
MHSFRSIRTNADMENVYSSLCQQMLLTKVINRGAAHAMKDDATSSTYELMHVTHVYEVDPEPSAWQEVLKPNLPWAEDHFQERVSGDPLNPPPSHLYWPFATKSNAEHRDMLGLFSHTYPERFWPKFAGDNSHEWVDIRGDDHKIKTIDIAHPLHGIRFDYGDLGDVVKLLMKNPRTRQAYLPVWFPEDTYAATQGERVPCSMGYHFIYNAERGGLDCVYSLRSCDLVRFYRDDMYMAGRLLQWVGYMANQKIADLVVHIDNLHAFPGDEHFLRQNSLNEKTDIRASYNFEALG